MRAGYREGMRHFTVAVAAVLLIIAMLGLGFGFWTLYSVLSLPSPGDRGVGFVGAMTVGAVPFLAGTVALAGAGSILATLATSEETVNELRAIHRLGAEIRK